MNHRTMTASPPSAAVLAAYRHCETVTGLHARNFTHGVHERAATPPAPGVGRPRLGPRTHVVGLYLAGAWPATGWPATNRGRVRSDFAAARAAT